MKASSPLRRRIAVIGTGVAGLTAGYKLREDHEITFFEKNNYLGGHTHTVLVEDGPDAGTPVDTGFIVMNHRNYPLFGGLLRELQVALEPSDMSFSYWCQNSDLYYNASDLNGLLARRRNLFRPWFHRMIRDILRFYKSARTDLEAERLGDETLGDYLEAGGYSHDFTHHHLAPMGSAIWSTPSSRMFDFPAKPFLRFLDNHGLLSLNDRPQWQSVRGGSVSYIRAMMRNFGGATHLQTSVQGIERTADGVNVYLPDGEALAFDAVIVATHADEALKLLRDPSEDERRLLGAWTYSNNRVHLHTWTGVMPPRQRAWASWNYHREPLPADGSETAPVSMTYHMNRLQNLKTETQFFVTLNRQAPIPDEQILRELHYTHPTYTPASMATQTALPKLNGQRSTWFCGSYFGYGFHEDAVRSALDVVKDLKASP